MARTQTITDEQILEAARAVFLEEGFSAQTAKIAQRAHVSEGTIFKRFPTKEALFYAALQIEQSPPWHSELEQRVGTGSCRQNLTSIFLSILFHFNDMLLRTITTLGSRGPMSSKMFEGLPEHPLLTDIGKLRAFLQREMELGRLRSSNAEFLARLILGTLTSYIFHTIVLGRHSTEQEFREFAAGTVELIWNGISPD